MKLIDASMFLKVAHSIKEFDDALDPITEELIEQIIEEQPTVEAIPVELYEQVKGERDVAIEQLKSLNIELFEKPYLKAIPIEWIKDYMLKLPDGSEAYECILVMLEEWKRGSGIEEDPDELLENYLTY